MKTLAKIQLEMQRAIAGRRADIEPAIALPPEGTRAGRLRVYQNAYVLRLVEFLANDYQKLLTYLGDVRFRKMAEGYIAAHPSDTPNARWFSRHLPDFLLKDPAYRRNPEIAEMASLERALNDVFDGPDAPICTMDDLSRISPESFAQTSFVLAPTVDCLTFTTNVTGIWASLKCGVAPPDPEDLASPIEVLVWRQSYGSRFRMLGAEEAMALSAVKDGLSFGHVCEMIAAFDDPDGAALRAAGYLRGWIEAEIISLVRLA